jgi:hypothetical protein
MEQTPFNYWRSFGLSVRAANGLVSAGINRIEDARNIDDRTLHLLAHHIGPRTLQQIREVAPHTPQPSGPVFGPHVGKRRMALALGLDLYETGKPCKYGHYSPRNTKTWACRECAARYNPFNAETRKFGAGATRSPRNAETAQADHWP